MTTSRPQETAWRLVLRAAQSARDTAYLGPRPAARAAAAHLSEEGPALWIATACVLAAQAAKGEFTCDLHAYWHELQADEALFPEQSGTRRAVRRGPGILEARDALPIEAARAASILEVFHRYGYELRRAGAEWVTRCPFHDDRRPSLRVNSAKRLWHCHVCGIGGDAIAFVMRRQGLDFTAAVREIAA